jgi:hypothetical protein
VKLEIIKKSSEFVADFSNFAEEKIFDGNDIGKCCVGQRKNSWARFTACEIPSLRLKNSSGQDDAAGKQYV